MNSIKIYYLGIDSAENFNKHVFSVKFSYFTRLSEGKVART